MTAQCEDALLAHWQRAASPLGWCLMADGASVDSTRGAAEDAYVAANNECGNNVTPPFVPADDGLLRFSERNADLIREELDAVRKRWAPECISMLSSELCVVTIA